MRWSSITLMRGMLKNKRRSSHDLDRDLDKEGNGYRLYMLRDLNGWARGRVRVGISGAFRVKREKYNGKGF